mgnify:CR=1 FL=1
MSYLFAGLFLFCCSESPQLISGKIQKALDDSDFPKAKNLAFQQLQILRPMGTDEAPYIQTLYDLARIYRQLDDSQMATHFYLRVLREASTSKKIRTEDKEALFLEIYKYAARAADGEIARYVAKSALRSLQHNESYPSPLFNHWLQILLPEYLAEKKSSIMLYAAQNLILTGNESQLHNGLYYLALAYYLQGSKDKFSKSSKKALESQGFPADYAVQLQILLGKEARLEKGILRSRNHYLQALEIYKRYELTKPLFLYDIYTGLGENYYLTRNFPDAKRYQKAAVVIAQNELVSPTKQKKADVYLAFLENEEKKYRK